MRNEIAGQAQFDAVNSQLAAWILERPELCDVRLVQWAIAVAGTELLRSMPCPEAVQ